MSLSTAPSTLGSVARRPRWIGALVFALAVAASFAALGQWQLERGIASAQVIERDTETVKPIAEIASAQQSVNTAADGQLVEARGSFIAESWIVLSGRSDGSGDEGGAWVVGRFDTDAAASVAVALGWAPTVADATSVVRDLDSTLADSSQVVTGRFLPGEPPQVDDFENGERSSLSPPAFVNLWPTPVEAVYGGYIVADTPAIGLSPIVADPPTGEVQLNWLNIFYAIEWVVFAGFAVYMWFRLVKDAWERENDPDGDDPEDGYPDDTDPEGDYPEYAGPGDGDLAHDPARASITATPSKTSVN